MAAGIAAATGMLLLAIAPRVARRIQRRHRATEHRRRFHREYVVPLREFARNTEG